MADERLTLDRLYVSSQNTFDHSNTSDAVGLEAPDYELETIDNTANHSAAGDSIQDDIFDVNDNKGLDFDPQAMADGLMGSTFQGSGSTLNYAMNFIHRGGLNPILQRGYLGIIGNLRGIGQEQAVAQYKKAMDLRKKGNAYYRSTHNGESEDVPGLNTMAHPNFAGSDAQLRFGKIIGDVFGLDAAMATFVSPTGGLVGPGNSYGFSHIFDPDSPTAVHGTIHDAAGYLYNYHGIGEGYDYLNRETSEDPGDPLSGQTNITWWHAQALRKGQSGDTKDLFFGGLAQAGSMFSDDNIREAISTASEADIARLPESQLTSMMDSLLGGWISDGDVDALVKILDSIDGYKLRAMRLHFEERDYYISNIGQRLTIKAKLGFFN